jgi:3-phenylpropionate/trans-cinnamate dioxygenase ferredoxin reductase component
VARFPNPLYDGVPRRAEHWTMVTETARRAGTSLGRRLSGQDEDPATFSPIPYFWSDQYDFRLQSFGDVALGGADIRVLEGDLDDEVAVGYHRDGNVVGVVLIGLNSRFPHYRRLAATIR